MIPPTRLVHEDDLHGYVDGVLDPVRHAEIAAYLDEHPDIAARVRDYEKQRELLRAAFADVPDEPLPASLNVFALAEERLVRRRIARWQVAAAFVLAVGGSAAGGWLLGSRPPSGVQVLAEEAAATYAVFTADARRPVELWAAQRDDLSRWVSNRLNHKLTPPDLSGVGYHLLGGRLVPTAHGPAAMFMYENDVNARLIIFVRPTPVMPDSAFEEFPVTRAAGFSWVDKGVGYSVVAREPSERLLELSRHVRDQAG